jgi:agmatine deiminase
MITDRECDTVYLADTIAADFTEITNELVKIIQNHGIKVKILDQTDDYWCRDYMPVQLSEKDFVQFIYRPNRYHHANEIEYISNPIKVEMANKLKMPRFSRLLLDGGNIIKSKETTIVSDRVFDDNMYQFFDKQSILNQLKSDLSNKIIVVPQYPNNKSGHAGFFIRFVDNKTVLINKTKGETEKEWLEKFLAVIESFGLRYYEITCAAKSKAFDVRGFYINYLEIGNLIIAPQFGYPEDKTALGDLQELFGKTHQIVPYKSDWISEYNGLFNSIGWCVKS